MTRLTGGALGAKSITLRDFDNFLDWLVTDGDGDDPQSLYAAVAWLFWCVNLRADSVAQIPYAVYPADLDEADETDDNAVEWDVPLEWMLWQVEAWLCLKAAAYVLKRENRVVLKDLQVLNANTMRVKEHDADGPTVFEQRVGGHAPREYDAEEILYFRTWSPKTDIGPGVAGGAVSKTATALIKNANEWASSFFENGAIPAVLLTSDSPLDPKVAREVETRWERLLKGVRNAYKTIAMGSGLKPTVIGQPVKDLAMPDLERTRKEQILAAHKIPPGLAEAKTNRAERDALQFELWTQCIIPEVMIHIAPVLNEHLFGPLDLRISFQYGAIEVIQREEIAKAESSSFLISGLVIPAYQENLISVDESRRVIDSILVMGNMPKLDTAFTPEEREPVAPAADDMAETPPGAGDAPGQGPPPKALPPEWGRLRVSSPN